MKLLNLCCGAVRPQGEEWTNVDNLHTTILPGTPERVNLDAESNYLNLDVEHELFPSSFHKHFDGIMMSHCLEHWDCQTGVKIMASCLDSLKHGGVLLVSVPDATLFRTLYDQDDGTNAVELFGEPIFEGDGEKTFTNYCLWNHWHKAILTEDALWHYFKRAGFSRVYKCKVDEMDGQKLPFTQPSSEQINGLWELSQQLNRLPFSLVMCGVNEVA